MLNERCSVPVSPDCYCDIVISHSGGEVSTLRRSYLEVSLHHHISGHGQAEQLCMGTYKHLRLCLDKGFQQS